MYSRCGMGHGHVNYFGITSKHSSSSLPPTTLPTRLTTALAICHVFGTGFSQTLSATFAGISNRKTFTQATTLDLHAIIVFLMFVTTGSMPSGAYVEPDSDMPPLTVGKSEDFHVFDFIFCCQLGFWSTSKPCL